MPEGLTIRFYLIVGGFAMIIDGILCVLTLGSMLPSLTIKVSKKRTDWVLKQLKLKHKRKEIKCQKK